MTVRRDAGEVVVAVSGRVDLATIGVLERCTEEALELAGPPRLVFDLARTTSIDRSGVNLILRAYARLGRHRDALVVRGPGPTVLRTLMLAGLDELVTIERPGGTAGPGPAGADEPGPPEDPAAG